MRKEWLFFFLFLFLISKAGGEGNLDTADSGLMEETPEYLILHIRESSVFADQDIIDDIEASASRIRIICNRRSDSEYDSEFPGILDSAWAPDMVQGESGYQLRQLTASGKIRRISSFVSGSDISSSINPGINYDETAYLASVWRNWSGLMYNPEIIYRYSEEIPVEWNSFLNLCEILKKSEMFPFYTDLGVYNTFFWFDYLDLRINGADFHSRLLSGEVSFNSPEIKDIFEIWADLINRGYFYYDLVSDLESAYKESKALFFLMNRVDLVAMNAFDWEKTPEIMEFPSFIFTSEKGEIAPAAGLVFPAKSSLKADVAQYLFHLREAVKNEKIVDQYFLNAPWSSEKKAEKTRYFNHFNKEKAPSYSQKMGEILIRIWTQADEEGRNNIINDLKNLR